MGLTLKTRLSLLIALLTFCIGIVYHGQGNLEKTFSNLTALDLCLSEVPDWHRIEPMGLNHDVVDALKLDDYVNSRYGNELGEVFLYIGQYWSSKKVGAAHDPMVCFPGQGWKVTDKSRGEINVQVGGKEQLIPYATIAAELGDRKQLLLYWFQAFDSAHANTFSQKLQTYWNTFLGQGETNSFVRLSTSLQGRSQLEAKRLLQDFIRDFYPLYLDCIYQSSP